MSCNNESCCSSNKGCGCGCQSKNCSCDCHSQGSCSSSHGSEDNGKCNFSKKLLELADHAWMEVLKEKIKKQIEASSPHMDGLAELVSTANRERWEKKMADKQCCSSYEEKLKEFFKNACKNKK